MEVLIQIGNGEVEISSYYTDTQIDNYRNGIGHFLEKEYTRLKAEVKEFTEQHRKNEA